MRDRVSLYESPGFFWAVGLVCQGVLVGVSAWVVIDLLIPHVGVVWGCLVGGLLIGGMFEAYDG